MMRHCIVFAVFVAMGAAHLSQSYTKTADIEFLHKQKKIFELFNYVDQNAFTDAEYFEIGRNYEIASNIDYYTNKEAVYDFLSLYKSGYLRKDGLFTYYKEEHRNEMMALFRLFFSAKDFTTFYKTACWARIHINPGMFVAAFSTAIIYRQDTKYIRLPAIYEIYPNMFFDSSLIRDAHRLKMTRGYGYHGYEHGLQYNKDSYQNVETFYVYSNYSDFCINPTYALEYKLNYFYEDVGLNACYYYFRMIFPFFVDSKYYDLPKFLRGDLYYFGHKQIMARYYLERLSNDLGGIEDFSWDSMSLPGFYNDISFFNGVSMPRRDWWNVVPFYKYRYIEYIKKLETRILEAIDSGFFYDESGKQISFYTPEGLSYLGNIIEGNCDSYNLKYYGAYDVLARDILGMNFDCKCKDYYVPSSLQYFSTSMRDPAFYRLYDRMMFFFQKYKSYLARYTKSELEFSGVKFENVEVDKITTYFDNKEYYINNAVAVNSYKEGRSFAIKARQYQLNYKPFSYKFAINSDKDTKGVLRIFLGPALEGEKYDEYSYFFHYYQYFFQLDEFEVNLKSGINNFERLSTDAPFFKPEYTSADIYYKKILNAIEGHEPFQYSSRGVGFPNRLMFPKGKPEGIRYKLFFYLGPFEESKKFELPYFGDFTYYGKSFGFPLDRPMYPWFFHLNNLYFKDINIYHLKDYSYNTKFIGHY